MRPCRPRRPVLGAGKSTVGHHGRVVGAVLDGVEGQGAVAGDRGGKHDESGEPAAPGPRDSPDQQCPRGAHIAAGGDLPELLFEQIGSAEPAVGLGEMPARVVR
jgi:hypothetical protein